MFKAKGGWHREDLFHRPPDIPRMAQCLVCRRIFMTSEMVFKLTGAGINYGLWCCPFVDSGCAGHSWHEDILDYRDEPEEDL